MSDRFHFHFFTRQVESSYFYCVIPCASKSTWVNGSLDVLLLRETFTIYAVVFSCSLWWFARYGRCPSTDVENGSFDGINLDIVWGSSEFYVVSSWTAARTLRPLLWRYPREREVVYDMKPYPPLGVFCVPPILPPPTHYCSSSTRNKVAHWSIDVDLLRSQSSSCLLRFGHLYRCHCHYNYF